MSHILPNWLAITIGHTIYAARPLSDPELAHELVHIQQWDRYGLGFPLRYAWASLAALRAGGSWYWDNAYEVEANDRADRATATE